MNQQKTNYFWLGAFGTMSIFIAATAAKQRSILQNLYQYPLVFVLGGYSFDFYVDQVLAMRRYQFINRMREREENSLNNLDKLSGKLFDQELDQFKQKYNAYHSDQLLFNNDQKYQKELLNNEA